MLSLIPALLLLALHGPTALERFGHEGRIPEALRKLEQVLAPIEADADSDDPPARLDKQRQVLASLAALSADPAFSKAISELFGLSFEAPASLETDLSYLTDLFDSRPGAPKTPAEQTQKGFLSSRRTRDGPA